VALGLTPVARKLQGLIEAAVNERPERKHVSADREGLLPSYHAAAFSLSAQLVKDEFHKILSAIRKALRCG